MNLAVNKITKRYGDQRALDGFTLQANDFSCLAFIGPSGGGKSTALRHLCGLEIPDSGEIRLNDSILPAQENELLNFRKSIGIVFQSYNLFPHFTALENVTLPLVQVHAMDAKNANSRAMELLGRFGLSNHANKRPAELSGGQSQRVAIARALAPDPSILFLDEPTSALDPEMTAEVLEAIESLVADGKKIVLVTHEMGFAQKAADQVAFIANGKVIEHSTSTDLFNRPQSQTCEKFLSRVLKY
ncbi:amino acid ABC transporter ATP-binding protein [Puniceicoccaceae bacterium K14]|nr:amino acid ABC transporter ATP-binding protein [Puniceicoccaceae bacterium K14]